MRTNIYSLHYTRDSKVTWDWTEPCSSYGKRRGFWEEREKQNHDSIQCYRGGNKTHLIYTKWWMSALSDWWMFLHFPHCILQLILCLCSASIRLRAKQKPSWHRFLKCHNNLAALELGINGMNFGNYSVLRRHSPSAVGDYMRRVRGQE